MNDNKCEVEFGLPKVDIYTLHYIMNILLYNGAKVTKIDGLCILLRRYSYPNRYLDSTPRFGRPVLHLCIITNQVMSLSYDSLHHVVTSFCQTWISPEHLKSLLCAYHMHLSGAPLENCWDFLDQTVCL